MTIVRPSLIISTEKQPFEGWTDTVSAAGIVAFPIAMGWTDLEYFTDRYELDLIPVDHVVNAMLISTVYAYHTPKPELNVFQVCSTAENLLRAQDFFTDMAKYLQKNPWPIATAEAKIAFTDDKATHTRHHRLKMLKLTA